MVTFSASARKLVCLLAIIVLATGMAAAQSSTPVSGGGTLQYTSNGPNYEECFLQVWSYVGSVNVSTYTPAGGGTPISLSGPTSLPYVYGSTSNGAGSQYGDPNCTDSSSTETYSLPNEAGDSCSLTVTASYSVPSASLSCTPIVISVPTTITLTQSPTGSLTVNQPYTLIAQVTPASGSVTPTGNVTFSGPGIQKTVAVSTSGVAIYPGTAPATAETITVTATFTPSSNAFLESSASINITTIPAPTCTPTVTYLFPSEYGPLASPMEDTLYVLVDQESGTTPPGGVAVIYVNGIPALADQVSGGFASVSWTPTSPGTYSIYASYKPSAAFCASQSSPPVVISVL